MYLDLDILASSNIIYTILNLPIGVQQLYILLENMVCRQPKSFWTNASSIIQLNINLLNLIYSHPFLYFPVFFALKSKLNGGTLSDAVDKYKNEIVDSVKVILN